MTWFLLPSVFKHNAHLHLHCQHLLQRYMGPIWALYNSQMGIWIHKELLMEVLCI